jgi:hypothetical protein
MKDILPSMPKGEIVGNMATTEMTQMIKVVIDGNRLFMENTMRTQMLQHKCEHRCCNTNANTDAATQMRTQMLQHKCEHRCCNTNAVVIDTMRTQMLSTHKC